MSSPTEGTIVEIDGLRLRLRPWAYEDGTRWSFRLLAIAGAAHASLAKAKTVHQQIGAALEIATEQDFIGLRDAAIRHTDLVVDEAGVDNFIQVKPDVHLRGRVFVVYALMKAHLEAQFSDFFGRLGDLFGSAPPPKGS